MIIFQPGFLSEFLGTFEISERLAVPPVLRYLNSARCAAKIRILGYMQTQAVHSLQRIRLFLSFLSFIAPLLDVRITRDNATPVKLRFRRELKRVHSISDYSTGRAAAHSRWKRHVKILTLIGKRAAGGAQQSKARPEFGRILDCNLSSFSLSLSLSL